MHVTHERKKRESEGFTITVSQQVPQGNLFPIEVQVAQAKAFDKRRERRKIKAKRKARKWDGE